MTHGADGFAQNVCQLVRFHLPLFLITMWLQPSALQHKGAIPCWQSSRFLRYAVSYILHLIFLLLRWKEPLDQLSFYRTVIIPNGIHCIVREACNRFSFPFLRMNEDSISLMSFRFILAISPNLTLPEKRILIIAPSLEAHFLFICISDWWIIFMTSISDGIHPIAVLGSFNLGKTMLIEEPCFSFKNLTHFIMAFIVALKYTPTKLDNGDIIWASLEVSQLREVASHFP